MKCGSCRNTEADSYKKIKQDDILYDILKNLHPDKVYNSKYSYFCEACINLAKARLLRKSTTISEQNPISFTVLNESNATSDSGSPKDEYDLMVMSRKVYSETGTPVVIPPNQTGTKRPATERPKPCPKRFKKPLAPIQLEATSRTADASHVPRQGPSTGESVSKNKSEVTAPPIITEVIADASSQRSSESISEEGNLLDVDDTSSNHSSVSVVQSQPKTTTADNRLADSSKSLSSKDLPNKETVIPSGSGSNSDKSVSQPETPLRRTDDSERSVTSSSDQQPKRTVDRHPSTSTSQRDVQVGTVPGPSAPPAKNPRIRQDNSNLPRDLREYFSTQTVNVNNYSRTLAG